jgi:dTDP-4-amino-4,6-dideoxygalactose transaminase
MRIGRTLPPAAAPLGWRDLCHAAAGFVSSERALSALEAEIRREFSVRHVFLVSSGTAALTVALLSLRSLSAQTKILIPAYTCFSIPAAIRKAGLRPALCDIEPTTFDFDHALLEDALDADTLCVVAHHLFGVPSDVERIRAICQARGIFVVEDAAQAMGVEWRGAKLGTLGDVGIFSLGRGKNITCGSGGVIVTNSDRIAEALGRQVRRLQVPPLLQVLKDFVQLVLMAIFIRPHLYWVPSALPFLRLGQTIFPRDVHLERLSGMKAGLLHDWRSRLARSNRIRSETASDFTRRLALGRGHARAAHPYLRLPVFAANAEERKRILSRSQARGLGLSIAYPTPINEIPEISAAFDGARFPTARRVAEHLLTIPTHQWLSEKDKKAIAECVGATAPTLRPLEERRKAS